MAQATANPVFTVQTRLLVVAPHPDDEVLAAGILIQRVQEAGGRVDILLLTDGDNNPWPQRVLERRLLIGQAGRARWAVRRRDEILGALRCLGVPADCLHAMGWPDQGLTPLLVGLGTELIQRVAAQVVLLQPTLVVMPALADRHPDHGTAHVLLRLALAGMAVQAVQWTYFVHGRPSTGKAVEIQGSARQRALKQAALAAHASQLALGGRRLRRLAAAVERFELVPDEACIGNRLPWSPPRWFGPWLRLDLADARGVRSWTWARAPRQRDRHGVEYLTAAAGPAIPGRFARLSLPRPRSPWIFDHWGWCEPGA